MQRLTLSVKVFTIWSAFCTDRSRWWFSSRANNWTCQTNIGGWLSSRSYLTSSLVPLCIAIALILLNKKICRKFIMRHIKTVISVILFLHLFTYRPTALEPKKVFCSLILIKMIKYFNWKKDIFYYLKKHAMIKKIW